MALTVTPRWSGDIYVLAMSGRMTIGPALISLGTRIASEIGERKPSGVIVNLESVTHYDSAGLGELVKLYTSASRCGSRLALAAGNQRLLEMLQVTRLDAILPHYDTEAAALRALLPAR